MWVDVDKRSSSVSSSLVHMKKVHPNQTTNNIPDKKIPLFNDNPGSALSVIMKTSQVDQSLTSTKLPEKHKQKQPTSMENQNMDEEVLFKKPTLPCKRTTDITAKNNKWKKNMSNNVNQMLFKPSVIVQPQKKKLNKEKRMGEKHMYQTKNSVKLFSDFFRDPFPFDMKTVGSGKRRTMPSASTQDVLPVNSCTLPPLIVNPPVNSQIFQSSSCHLVPTSSTVVLPSSAQRPLIQTLLPHSLHAAEPMLSNPLPLSSPAFLTSPFAHSLPQYSPLPTKINESPTRFPCGSPILFQGPSTMLTLLSQPSQVLFSSPLTSFVNFSLNLVPTSDVSLDPSYLPLSTSSPSTTPIQNQLKTVPSEPLIQVNHLFPHSTTVHNPLSQAAQVRLQLVLSNSLPPISLNPGPLDTSTCPSDSLKIPHINLPSEPFPHPNNHLSSPKPLSDYPIPTKKSEENRLPKIVAPIKLLKKRKRTPNISPISPSSPVPIPELNLLSSSSLPSSLSPESPNSSKNPKIQFCQVEILNKVPEGRLGNPKSHYCNKCREHGKLVDNRYKHKCPHENCNCNQCCYVDKERKRAKKRMKMKKFFTANQRNRRSHKIGSEEADKTTFIMNKVWSPIKVHDRKEPISRRTPRIPKIHC